jgi:hypothetical protein
MFDKFQVKIFRLHLNIQKNKFTHKTEPDYPFTYLIVEAESLVISMSESLRPRSGLAYICSQLHRILFLRGKNKNTLQISLIYSQLQTFTVEYLVCLG